MDEDIDESSISVSFAFSYSTAQSFIRQLVKLAVRGKNRIVFTKLTKIRRIKVAIRETAKADFTFPSTFSRAYVTLRLQFYQIPNCQSSDYKNRNAFDRRAAPGGKEVVERRSEEPFTSYRSPSIAATISSTAIVAPIVDHRDPGLFGIVLPFAEKCVRTHEPPLRRAFAPSRRALDGGFPNGGQASSTNSLR